MGLTGKHLCGAFAAFLFANAAHAADFPAKVRSVEYLGVCAAYGKGFSYIPGSDTCMQIGGYLRADATFNGGIYNAPAWSGDLGQHNRYQDYFAVRSRMSLTVDTRTSTEYGVVRAFGHGDFQFSTLGVNTFNPNAINATAPVGGVQLLDTPGGGYVIVEFLFVQLGGFTFGKSNSAYSTPWNGFPGNNSSFLLGSNDTVAGVNNIQYTAEFGNGISGTIGLDEPTAFNRTVVYNLSSGLNATLNSGQAYAGTYAPDIVGRLRVDQPWGLFQISAAAHQVNGSYDVLNTVGAPAGATGLAGAAPTSLSEINGHPDTRWGGSVMAAMNIKNIPTGVSDDIKVSMSFAKGDTKNVIATAAASPSFAMFGSSANSAAYGSIGFGATTDGLWLPQTAGGDGRIHLTKAFGIRGAFNHNWDPYWSSSLFGSYSVVRYDSEAKASLCSVYSTPAKAVSVDYTCNPDFNASQLGVITLWTPVTNLTFSAEVMWFHLDQKFSGSAVLGPSAPKPDARYEFKDQDAISFNVRVQRNF
jgi:hypothetical protein